jgi:OOP family OmpA-OmpF porin
MKIIKLQQKYIFPCLLILGGCTSPSPANPLGNLSEHWYVGGSIGQSNMHPDGGNTWKTTDSTDMAKKLYVGKDVSPQIGLEAFWADFGDAKLTSNVKAHGSVNYKAIGANIVYKAPYKIAGVQPIGKLGVAKFSNSDKGEVSSKQKHMLTILGGVGAEYDISDKLKLRAEYEYYDKDINQFNIGVNWSPQSRGHSFIAKQQRPAPAPKEPNIIYVPQPAPKPITIEKPIFIEKPVFIEKPIIVHQPAPKPVIIHQPAPTPRYKTVHKTLSGGSHFASGSARLTFDGKDALNRLAQDLRNQRLALKSIQIIGHTDSIGSNQSNNALSFNRANTVANYLASRGINRGVIHTQGMGESQPIASNKTKYGRAQNRRVEIAIKASSRERIGR